MTNTDTNERTIESTQNFSPIADLLICPQCSGRLDIQSDNVLCSSCSAEYPIHEGVPLLARMGTAENWNESKGNELTSESYQQNYQRVDEAAKYNEMYSGSRFKSLSTAKEYRLLKSLLSSQEKCELLLDLPSGGGRLSPQIAPFTNLLIEADIAEGQVLYGKQTMKLATPQFWMTASAFHIPFKDNSIDGIVCCRLCHHLPTASERERLIKELLRVSKRFVIMTYFDFYSIKNTLRRIRRPFNNKPPKMTMTTARVQKLAEENGARLEQNPMVSAMASGHRYALMVKNK